MQNAAMVRERINSSQVGDAHPNRSVLATPPPAHSESSSTRTTLPTNSAHMGPTGLLGLPSIPFMNMMVPSTVQPRKLHLLVCVGGREFQTLAKVRHVEMTDDWNDGMLLRALLREYEEARQGRQWSISSLLPALPAKIRNSSVINYLSTAQMISAIRHSFIWDLCRQWVLDGSLWAPLHMPSTADFVKVIISCGYSWWEMSYSRLHYYSSKYFPKQLQLSPTLTCSNAVGGLPPLIHIFTSLYR